MQLILPVDWPVAIDAMHNFDGHYDCDGHGIGAGKQTLTKLASPYLHDGDDMRQHETQRLRRRFLAARQCEEQPLRGEQVVHSTVVQQL